MAVDFASGYVTPSLRKAVFDKLHPGNTVLHEVMLLSDYFPIEIVEDDGEATHCVVCTIVCDDGSYVEGAKEIVNKAWDKRSNKWVDRPMTTDAWYSDCTKAMGRALTTGGIPMNKEALKLLMSYAFPQPASTAKPARTVDHETGEIDGPPRELTLEQQLAVRVADMTGPEKVALATWAKNELQVGNLMKAGEHASAILEHIESG